MSGLISVTDGNFAPLVLGNRVPVLVEFWAPWCGPCRQLTPVLEGLAQEYGNRLVVLRMNVDENPVTAASYRVQSVPTTLLFQDGEPVRSWVGAQPRAKFIPGLDLTV